MSLETLKKSIFWCMKENISIQFVSPDYNLPEEYIEVIESIDHIDLCSLDGLYEPDIVIANNNDDMLKILAKHQKYNTVNLRCKLDELKELITSILKCLHYGMRVNLMLLGIEDLTRESLTKYKELVHLIYKNVLECFVKGENPQLNIITDRLKLDTMNNCNAGVSSITIAPNGYFYICPAFYYENEMDNIGSVDTMLEIKNRQLYDINHAPICRNCDAFHCHRCIWLNKKMTNEVNTPSYQQCMLSHIERDCSRLLSESIKELYPDFRVRTLNALDYIDPFEIVKK